MTSKSGLRAPARNQIKIWSQIIFLFVVCVSLAKCTSETQSCKPNDTLAAPKTNSRLESITALIHQLLPYPVVTNISDYVLWRSGNWTEFGRTLFGSLTTRLVMGDTDSWDSLISWLDTNMNMIHWRTEEYRDKEYFFYALLSWYALTPNPAISAIIQKSSLAYDRLHYSILGLGSFAKYKLDMNSSSMINSTCIQSLLELHSVFQISSRAAPFPHLKKSIGGLYRSSYEGFGANLEQIKYNCQAAAVFGLAALTLKLRPISPESNLTTETIQGRIQMFTKLAINISSNSCWFDESENYYTNTLARHYRVQAFNNLVLYRLTRDEKYRDLSWDLVESIRLNAYVVYGGRAIFYDPMVLSATLKYLYLTFADVDRLPLEKWIFTEEGLLFPAWNGPFLVKFYEPDLENTDPGIELSEQIAQIYNERHSQDQN